MTPEQAAVRAVLHRYELGLDDAATCYLYLAALGLIDGPRRILPLTPSARAQQRGRQLKKAKEAS